MGYNFWPIIISFWRYIPDISPKIYLYGDISLYVSKRYNYWAKNISQEIYLQKMLKFGNVFPKIYLTEIYLWRYISQIWRYILPWRYIFGDISRLRDISCKNGDISPNISRKSSNCQHVLEISA